MRTEGMSREPGPALPVVSSQSRSPRQARIFISTGEVSGDLQGALLVEALRRQAEQLGWDLEILGLGGDRMAQSGATLIGNTTAIGAMGLLEALPYILPTLQLQQRATRQLLQQPPDLVVLIDYGGPNMRMGTFVRRQLSQVPLVYYIAPQEWVWSFGPRNSQRIVGNTDRMLAIFPAEATYYAQYGANITYVGHPLIDRIPFAPSREFAREQLGIPADQVAIALLPASRHQELKYLMPVLFQAAQQIQAQLPQVHFWIPLSIPQFRPSVERAIAQYQLQATLLEGSSHLAIAAADLALTKSGTANLEIALMNVPQVVAYRVNPVTAWIAEHVLKFSIPFMSPPNLVLMEPIVPEFLQYYATPEAIAQSALKLLLESDRRQQMLADYARMRKAMGEAGVCDRAAQEIFKLLEARRVSTSSGG